MIIHFTVKTVVKNKFEEDDKIGGKERVKAYWSNTSEKSCDPKSSYNEDGKEFGHLREH